MVVSRSKVKTGYFRSFHPSLDVESVSCFLLAESVPSFLLTGLVAVAGRGCATEPSRAHGPTLGRMRDRLLEHSRALLLSYL